MVMIANPTQTAWTVDASQISAWTVDASKILPAENAQELELPIPHEEAARMSPMPWFDGVDEVIDRAGVFATYGAGIGAAGGAIAAEAKGEGIDNGFQLGAGYGGVVGLVAGAIVEDLRISLSRETKEAGDANEKMKFLALKDKSILYSGYVTLGYVYFVQPTKELKSVRILLTRGDPSKDWTIAPSNELFQTSDYCSNASHSNEECCKKRELCKRIPKNERWPEFDLSPVVCECPVDLHRCNTSQNQVACHALGGGRSDSGSCRDIVNLQGVVKGEPSTTISWPKWH
jgi:hypothetical protein